jgi:hypothetical protein
MKKYYFLQCLVAVFFCNLFLALQLIAADLELDDFSGQAGPAPPPAPYTTTTLWINNAPNDVFQFRVEINYGKNILGGHICKIKEPIKSWQYTQVGHLSSTSRNAYYIDCWTTDTPILAGSSLAIAEITFEVKINSPITVKLQNLEHDIEGWTTQDGNFTPITLGVAPVANAGPDQIVYDRVILNGTQSYDPDGEIIHYQWQLNHRENPAYNTSAEGSNPTVQHLQKGFYHVILTVTDNDNLIDRDFMEIASFGPKKVVVIPLF